MTAKMTPKPRTRQPKQPVAKWEVPEQWRYMAENATTEAARKSWQRIIKRHTEEEAARRKTR